MRNLYCLRTSRTGENACLRARGKHLIKGAFFCSRTEMTYDLVNSSGCFTLAGVIDPWWRTLTRRLRFAAARRFCGGHRANVIGVYLAFFGSQGSLLYMLIRRVVTMNAVRLLFLMPVLADILIEESALYLRTGICGHGASKACSDASFGIPTINSAPGFIVRSDDSRCSPATKAAQGE